MEMEKIAPSGDLPVTGAGGSVSVPSPKDVAEWGRHRNLFYRIVREVTPNVVRYRTYRDMHSLVGLIAWLLAEREGL